MRLGVTLWRRGLGFQAAIVCDGKELESYEPAEDGRAVSGWIATNVGKVIATATATCENTYTSQEFTIRIRQVTTGHRQTFRTTVFLDGSEVDRCSDRNPDSCTIRGMYPTTSTFTTFRFAALRTTG